MKKLATVLGATLVVIGIAAMHLRQEIRAQREQNTGMARVAALEPARSSGSMVVAQQSNDGAQAATLNPSSAAQTESPSGAPAARGQSAASSDNPLRAEFEQLQNNPQFQEMQRVMMRQMLEEEFPDVAKEFNLGKDKKGKLLDLLVKQRMDLVADSMGQLRGGTQDHAAREKAFEADLKALLGNDYAKWNKYEDAASARQREEYVRVEREELRHAITADGTPLTDPQFDHLTAAITAEQGRIEKESGALSPKQYMQRLPEFNRRLANVAAPHLNPQQLDRYRSYLQEQQEMMSDMDVLDVFPED